METVGLTRLTILMGQHLQQLSGTLIYEEVKLERGG